MPKEKPQPEVFMGDERFDVVLGQRFMPFHEEQSFYETPKDKVAFDIPEGYDHFIYLRKWISLYGIDGFVDVIEESPTIVVDMLMSTRFRTFTDHPMGPTEHKTKITEGEWENIEAPAIMRFSFLTKSPSDYAKLLSTYGDVEIGDSKFYLTFNFNQRTVKRGFKILEEENELLVVEKNLFNYNKLAELEKSESVDKEDDQSERKSYGNIPTPDEDPGRICFVSLPVDIDKLRGIGITFKFGFDIDDKNAPDPNSQPSRLTPVFV